MVQNPAYRPPAKTVDFRAVDALLARSGHSYKTRNVLGAEIPMRELTVLEWLSVAQRYPQLVALFEGLMPTEDGEPKEDPRRLFAGLGPEPIAAVVAIAIGHPDPDAFEQNFISADFDTVTALGFEVLEAAFGTGGFEDFFSRLAQFLEKMAPEKGEETENPDQSQPKPKGKSGRKTASARAAA